MAWRLAQPLVHLRLEEAEGAAAVRLGGVERKIGVLQQHIGIVAVLRRERDAEAAGRIDQSRH